MKIATNACLLAALLFGLTGLPALAQTEEECLTILNADPSREQKLTSGEVILRASKSPDFPGLVTAGFRQSDGSYALGSVFWGGKAWSPMAGFAHILKERGFAQASDQERARLFLSLLKESNEPLGITPYVGVKSREANRPQPFAGDRQVDGQHRFTVWFCEAPATREGPEWRKVLYLVPPDLVSLKARTLETYNPDAEGLKDFPPMPATVSD